MVKPKRKTTTRQQSTCSGSSHDATNTKKPKTESSSPPALLEGGNVEENKVALEEKLIRKYIKFVDPLVRFTFNTTNTTAAERLDMTKAAIIFMQRGPNVAAGALPVGFAGVNGLVVVADPGNDATAFRFSGAQQIANWIADAQARGYAAGVGVVRFTVELTSDNGRHWSAPFEVMH